MILTTADANLFTKCFSFENWDILEDNKSSTLSQVEILVVALDNYNQY